MFMNVVATDDYPIEERARRIMATNVPSKESRHAVVDTVAKREVLHFRLREMRSFSVIGVPRELFFAIRSLLFERLKREVGFQVLYREC